MTISHMLNAMKNKVKEKKFIRKKAWKFMEKIEEKEKLKEKYLNIEKFSENKL